MAWPFRSGFFAKPSRLEKPCTICARPIPFDPTNPLCAQCSYQANEDLAQAQNNQTFNYDPHNTYSAYAPATPSSSLKRSAEPSAAEGHPIKRAFTSTYNAFTNPLIRRTVVDPAAPIQFGTPDFTDIEAGDEFKDAREQPSSMLYGQYSARGNVAGDDYRRSMFTTKQSDYEDGDGTMDMTTGIDGGGTMEIDEDVEEDEEEEADLFHSTFGPRTSQDSDDDDGESSGDNDDDDEGGDDQAEGDCEGGEHEQESNTKPASRDAANSQNKQILNQENIANLGLVGDKTLGSTASRSSTLLLTGPRDPDPEKDLSQNLRQFEKFKDKAVELIPKLPLSAHRYWIGVLREDVKAKNIKNETDFIWMKGNRLTTVSTAWHTYSTTTASEDFALLLGYERPAVDVRMEELDYFNEKKIIFRAVDKNSDAAKGKEMCEGLVPPEVVTEVIELD